MPASNAPQGAQSGTPPSQQQASTAPATPQRQAAQPGPSAARRPGAQAAPQGQARPSTSSHAAPRQTPPATPGTTSAAGTATDGWLVVFGIIGIIALVAVFCAGLAKVFGSPSGAPSAPLVAVASAPAPEEICADAPVIQDDKGDVVLGPVLSCWVAANRASNAFRQTGTLGVEAMICGNGGAELLEKRTSWGERFVYFKSNVGRVKEHYRTAPPGTDCTKISYKD